MTIQPTFNYRGEYDENLPLPAFLTQEQYSHVVFRPDAHFIDGHIIPRHLGDRTHSDTLASLIGQLDPPCRALGISCCLSLRLQISTTRIRVCDLVALKPRHPPEQVPTTAPLLCIEVLAPGQHPSDELDTLADYLAMGVENIWLIDPIRRAAFIYGATGLHEADPNRLTVPDTPIHLDMTEAFAGLD